MGSQRSAAPEWHDTQKDTLTRLDEARLAKMMQALRRVARLQRDATSASVKARERKREVSFKRQEAWVSDAKFMAEIQRLGAHGEFERFELLQNLASQCQITRDDLGLREQEGFEAEQEWEGHIWNLRQAEEQLTSEFEYEFQIAETYPESDTEYSAPNTFSDAGSGFSSEPPQINHGVTLPVEEIQITAAHFDGLPQIGSRIEGDPSCHLLLGLTISDQDTESHGDLSLRSYSGIDDIDEYFGDRQSEDFKKIPDAFPKTPPNNFELYPQLLNEFISRRDRINKWLEYTLQVSHLEGLSMFTILRDTLKTENMHVPSNWSQLVIAFWGFDEAALPGLIKPEMSRDLQIDKLSNHRSQEINIPFHSENSQKNFRPPDLQSRLSRNPSPGNLSGKSKKKWSHSASELDTSTITYGHFQDVLDGGHRSQP